MTTGAETPPPKMAPGKIETKGAENSAHGDDAAGKEPDFPLSTEADPHKGDVQDAILAATGDAGNMPVDYFSRARHWLITFNLIGIATSAAAFWYAIEANQIQKAQITTQMATSLGSEQVSEALFVVRDTLLQPPVNKQEHDDFLKKIQPLKRSLEAFGICVELQSCNKEYVIRFACDEALSLADAQKVAAKESGVSVYIQNDYHGLLTHCEKEAR